MPNEQTHGFGRLHVPDARDAAYPMRAALRPAPLPVSRYYKTGALPLDQGQTGTCTAHSAVGFLMAAPMMTKAVPSPFDIYRDTVANDEFEENDVEAQYSDAMLQMGTSVRATVQTLRRRGYIKSFVWAESTDDMAKWLLTGKGTVMLGTDWHWNMSDLDSQGVARLGGGIAGGHAYLCIGYNRITRMFRCMNSWGRSFGSVGRFWITHDDMGVLLAAAGEACAAVEQHVAPVA